jgi:hypothetical protein
VVRIVGRVLEFTLDDGEALAGDHVRQVQLHADFEIFLQAFLEPSDAAAGPVGPAYERSSDMPPTKVS